MAPLASSSLEGPIDHTLTPVKVRGKKRKRNDASPAVRRSEPHSELDQADDNAEREDNIIYTKQVPGKQGSKSRIADGRITSSKRNTLQSMPTEILEQIFFECLEVNLLQVLPQLAQAVSTPRIYHCIATLAIWEDPDEEGFMKNGNMNEQTRNLFNLSEKEIMKRFRPIGYRPLPIEEKKRLQSQILNCHWATFKLIASCVVECVDLTRLRINCYHKAKIGSVNIEEIMEEMEYRHLENYLDNLNLREPTGAPQSLRHALSKLPETSDIPVAFAYVFVIPSKVIDGRPWTPDGGSVSEKLNFFRLLRLLLHPEKDPEPTQPFSRDVLHEGVRQAIIENDSTTVQRLLELDEYCVRSREFAFRSTLSFINSAYEIPPEHFVTAVRHSEGPEMLQTLVRACAESLPYDNPEITEWALHGAENYESGFYQWLLDLMVELPSYQKIHSSNQSMFVCGLLNASGFLGSSKKAAYRKYKRAWKTIPLLWAVQLVLDDKTDAREEVFPGGDGLKYKLPGNILRRSFFSDLSTLV
ncbi:uncharacterized protein GIQ15_00183 [Arthroderma uncinatum]|uniref:uncharacterized protein n=1 Tax=Arthroderma uncinatum TaxID=74035 RepID=UPI00144AD196|nr:uncharacterized protein GIQ15_00183 [Arthroderma uncinatum]KAF3490666.1 hypothetical protein GIQ15_00183 [Arthroderma uncinatum]